MNAKTSLWTLVLVSVAAVGRLGLAPSRAEAQAFGFNYASPGVSFGVGTGPYGGAFYGGGYPVVARPPLVVAPAPVYVAPPPPVFVAPPPVVVARPFYGYGPRPFYGPYPYGGYRPNPYHYYRR